jgi:hypothetical protein
VAQPIWFFLRSSSCLELRSASSWRCQDKERIEFIYNWVLLWHCRCGSRNTGTVFCYNPKIIENQTERRILSKKKRWWFLETDGMVPAGNHQVLDAYWTRNSCSIFALVESSLWMSWLEISGLKKSCPLRWASSSLIISNLSPIDTILMVRFVQQDWWVA